MSSTMSTVSFISHYYLWVFVWFCSSRACLLFNIVCGLFYDKWIPNGDIQSLHYWINAPEHNGRWWRIDINNLWTFKLSLKYSQNSKLQFCVSIFSKSNTKMFLFVDLCLNNICYFRRGLWVNDMWQHITSAPFRC